MSKQSIKENITPEPTEINTGDDTGTNGPAETFKIRGGTSTPPPVDINVTSSSKARSAAKVNDTQELEINKRGSQGSTESESSKFNKLSTSSLKSSELFYSPDNRSSRLSYMSDYSSDLVSPVSKVQPTSISHSGSDDTVNRKQSEASGSDAESNRKSVVRRISSNDPTLIRSQISRDDSNINDS